MNKTLCFRQTEKNSRETGREKNYKYMCVCERGECFAREAAELCCCLPQNAVLKEVGARLIGNAHSWNFGRNRKYFGDFRNILANLINIFLNLKVGNSSGTK